MEPPTDDPLAQPGSPAKYTRVPECISADLAGEVAILDPKNGMYYGMNEVGAAIWEFIATGKTLLEITNMIVELYNVSPAQCEADVLHLLGQLQTSGLIRIDATAD